MTAEDRTAADIKKAGIFEDARPILDAMEAADRRALLLRLARRHVAYILRTVAFPLYR